MATRTTLLCDWCGQVPHFMDKPVKVFSYWAQFKFAQCESKYEFCSGECLYAKIQSMLNENKK